MIQFDHAVKYKGKYYPANTPIVDAPQEAENAPQEAEKDEADELTEEKPAAPKKAVKGRKKGDA